ncbi:hypothetical protein PG984_010041 [Apiospora sp. TS-2023a]
MEGQLQCTICGSTSAKYCSGCRSAAYCSQECQQTDWHAHKHLCSSFQECYAARPSPSHYLVICFPMVNDLGCKPQLHWLNTKEISTGYFEPELDQLLQVPGPDTYLGRGIQIVRNNVLRGRPKLPDSLNIWYLTNYDGNDAVQVNATLHGGPRCVCLDGLGETFWKGPIVAYLKAGNDFDAAKMTDMNLTAYRDAIDYLAWFRETIGSMIDPVGSTNNRYGQLMMGNRSGKVKGVRINCIGDQQSGDDPAMRQDIVQVEVPKAHPLFTLGDDDPLPIPKRFGESWVACSYPQSRWRGEDTDAQERAQNLKAKMLMRQITRPLLTSGGSAMIPKSRLKWTTGSIFLVNRDKTDLDVRKVRAVCRLLEERVEPLLGSRVGADVNKVFHSLKKEVLEQYM